MHDDPVRWLFGLQRFGIKLGLEGIRGLLDELGRPEESFPSILVGGTNGKGSVAATLEALLREAGLQTGLFTSPHLVRPNERIRIEGTDIADEPLARTLVLIRDAIGRGLQDGRLQVHPSFFEVMTAAALLAFGERRVDIGVLEVGLGGRLDATNAVPARASVIVTVDLDHTERLGRTLEAIAAEKAGIVKPGRPVVAGLIGPEPLEVIRAACEGAGAPLLEAARLTLGELAADGTATLEVEGACYPGIRLALAGRHQIDNARVALLAHHVLSRELRFGIEADAVRRAMSSVRWPGRLQRIEGRPALLLDGAHNAAGSAALAEHVRQSGEPRPVLLFAAMRDKDVDGLLGPLAGLVEGTVTTQPAVDRAADPAQLAVAAGRILGAAEAIPSPAAALQRARELAGPDGLVLVAGSLYLVGTVLGLLEGRDVPGPVAM